MEAQIKSWLTSGIFDELSNEPKTTIPLVVKRPKDKHWDLSDMQMISS